MVYSGNSKHFVLPKFLGGSICEKGIVPRVPRPNTSILGIDLRGRVSFLVFRGQIRLFYVFLCHRIVLRPNQIRLSYVFLLKPVSFLVFRDQIRLFIATVFWIWGRYRFAGAGIVPRVPRPNTSFLRLFHCHRIVLRPNQIRLIYVLYWNHIVPRVPWPNTSFLRLFIATVSFSVQTKYVFFTSFYWNRIVPRVPRPNTSF